MQHKHNEVVGLSKRELEASKKKSVGRKSFRFFFSLIQIIYCSSPKVCEILVHKLMAPTEKEREPFLFCHPTSYGDH